MGIKDRKERWQKVVSSVRQMCINKEHVQGKVGSDNWDL